MKTVLARLQGRGDPVVSLQGGTDDEVPYLSDLELEALEAQGLDPDHLQDQTVYSTFLAGQAAGQQKAWARVRAVLEPYVNDDKSLSDFVAELMALVEPKEE